MVTLQFLIMATPGMYLYWRFLNWVKLARRERHGTAGEWVYMFFFILASLPIATVTIFASSVTLLLIVALVL